MHNDVNLCIGQTFECTERIFALGGYRVVFEQRVQDRQQQQDYFLVVMSADRFGYVRFEHPTWKAESAQVIAASRLREKQETMLLMRIGDWIETNLGRWYLTSVRGLQAGAALQLDES